MARRKLVRIGVGLAAAVTVAAVGGSWSSSKIAAGSTNDPAGRPSGAPSGGGPRPGAADRAVPVQVATAASRDLRVAQTAVGTIVPRTSVVVRVRVAGPLVGVLFHEGELVSAGERLAEIDSRPFQAQLAQVEGQLARDTALLKNARLDLERYRGAADVLAKQQVDAQASLVGQYEGNVRSDQGLVDSAKLQLSFTEVTAPIGGRIGLRQVDVGNIVNPTDATGLAVINEVQPITAVFSLPEDSVAVVARRLGEAKRAGRPLPVEVWDRGNAGLLATGALLAIDNQIDTSTGTYRLRATFDNRDGVLFPNQFVNVRLVVDTRRAATVIPEAAVQRGNAGPFVYVVKPDQSVTVRPVRLGPLDGETVGVDHGLVAGEAVVVDGTDKLREGAKVATSLLAAVARH